MLTYRKTRKGMEELLVRRGNLDAALNSVLILVDGERSIAEILRLSRAAHAPADALATLVYGGYIERTAPAVITPTKASAQSEQDAAFQLLYRGMVDIALNELGLRGIRIQLRIERAVGLQELRALAQPLADAVARVRGLSAGQAALAKLNRLMAAAPTPAYSAPAHMALAA
ncbi:MAG: hypothetical protein KGJ44_01985 [Betaproteobacteria bacterium]|nr:hypothetical protein [Betaproteobacteria bacterium]